MRFVSVSASTMITMPIEGGLRVKLSIWNESLLDYVSVLERGFARGKANTQVLQCFGQTFRILDIDLQFCLFDSASCFMACSCR